MAYSEIKPIHQWEGRSKQQVLSEVIDYVVNPKKTTYIDKDGVLKTMVQTYRCGINIADEWCLLKSLYKKITGRDQGKNDILGYVIKQSFNPKDNVSPELANKIGYEMAEKLSKGEFSFVVGTHLDKKHVHNHIVINSTALNATHKYRNIIDSFNQVIKNLNDELSKKYNLSIIDNVKNKKQSHEVKTKTKYIHWLRANPHKVILQEEKPTWQNVLRQIIDIILSRKSKYNVLSDKHKEKILNKLKGEIPKDIDEFIKILRSCGYEIKDDNRKYLSVKAKEQGQMKFTRLKKDTLGEEYTKENIKDYILKYNSLHNKTEFKEWIEKQEKQDSKRTPIKQKTTSTLQSTPRLNRIIDIKNNEKAKANVGYEKWAKIQNLKNLADTHSYLSVNNLTFDEVKNMIVKKEKIIDTLEIQEDLMNQHSKRQKEISALQNQLITYVKNRKVFDEYKKGGYNKSFKEKNIHLLEQYNEARKYFDMYKSKHGIKKLPTMKELKEEFAQLKSIK